MQISWLAWAGVHLEFLATSSLRVAVFVQWVWTYLTGQRGSRLIVNHHAAQQMTAKPVATEAPPQQQAMEFQHRG